MPCDICICRYGHTVSAKVLSDPAAHFAGNFAKFSCIGNNFCERILGEIWQNSPYKGAEALKKLYSLFGF